MPRREQPGPKSSFEGGLGREAAPSHHQLTVQLINSTVSTRAAHWHHNQGASCSISLFTHVMEARPGFPFIPLHWAHTCPGEITEFSMLFSNGPCCACNDASTDAVSTGDISDTKRPLNSSEPSALRLWLWRVSYAELQLCISRYHTHPSLLPRARTSPPCPTFSGDFLLCQLELHPHHPARQCPSRIMISCLLPTHLWRKPLSGRLSFFRNSYDLQIISACHLCLLLRKKLSVYQL